MKTQTNCATRKRAIPIKPKNWFQFRLPRAFGRSHECHLCQKNRRHKFYKSMNTPPQNKKEPRIENSHGKCTQQTKATLFPTTLWVGRGSHHHPKWTFNHLAVPSKHSACTQSDAQVKVEARRPIGRIAGCGYSPEVGTLSSNVHALSPTVSSSILADEDYQVAVFKTCPGSQSQTVWQHFSLKDSVSVLSIRPTLPFLLLFPRFCCRFAILSPVPSFLFFFSDLADRTRHGPYNCVSGEKQ